MPLGFLFVWFMDCQGLSGYEHVLTNIGTFYRHYLRHGRSEVGRGTLQIQVGSQLSLSLLIRHSSPLKQSTGEEVARM